MSFVVVDDDNIEDRCEVCSLVLVKKVATLVRRRLVKLSRTVLAGRDDDISPCGRSGCCWCNGGAPPRDEFCEAEGVICPDFEGVYFSRSLLIARRRLLHELTCSPPSRLAQT